MTTFHSHSFKRISCLSTVHTFAGLAVNITAHLHIRKPLINFDISIYARTVMFTYKCYNWSRKLITVNSIKQPQRALLFAPNNSIKKKKIKTIVYWKYLLWNSRIWNSVATNGMWKIIKLINRSNGEKKKKKKILCPGRKLGKQNKVARTGTPQYNVMRVNASLWFALYLPVMMSLVGSYTAT